MRYDIIDRTLRYLQTANEIGTLDPVQVTRELEARDALEDLRAELEARTVLFDDTLEAWQRVTLDPDTPIVSRSAPLFDVSDAGADAIAAVESAEHATHDAYDDASELLAVAAELEAAGADVTPVLDVLDDVDAALDVLAEVERAHIEAARQAAEMDAILDVLAEVEAATGDSDYVDELLDRLADGDVEFVREAVEFEIEMLPVAEDDATSIETGEFEVGDIPRAEAVQIVAELDADIDRLEMELREALDRAELAEIWDDPEDAEFWRARAEEIRQELEDARAWRRELIEEFGADPGDWFGDDDDIENDQDFIDVLDEIPYQYDLRPHVFDTPQEAQRYIDSAGLHGLAVVVRLGPYGYGVAVSETS